MSNDTSLDIIDTRILVAGKQPFRRDTDERRGPPREGWDSGNPSRNARRPLSGKYDSGTKPRTFFEKPNGPQLRQGVHRLNANKRQSFSVGPRSGQWAKRSAASAQRPERQKTAHQAQQQPGNTRDKPTAARKSLPQVCYTWIELSRSTISEVSVDERLYLSIAFFLNESLIKFRIRPGQQHPRNNCIPRGRRRRK